MRITGLVPASAAARACASAPAMAWLDSDAGTILGAREQHARLERLALLDRYRPHQALVVGVSTSSAMPW